MDMLFLRFFFKRWSLAKQADFMKKKGIMLASRKKSGRTIYIYMFESLFAEITFSEDDQEKQAERLLVLGDLEKLNKHLERETKAAV
jgi:hypothetical protein